MLELIIGAITRALVDGTPVLAVSHSGDSDSTGAVAGNLLGILYPEQILSHRWASMIECKDLIARLARDFVDVMDSDDASEDYGDDYPGW